MSTEVDVVVMGLGPGGEAVATELAQAGLAVVGIGAYRVAFEDRTAVVGPQELRLGDTAVWVLPNPSGLNAHYTPATLGEAFATLAGAGT